MSSSKVIPIESAARARVARTLDQSALQHLIGYNLRRADVVMRQSLFKTLSDWGLRPAEYSALVLIANNKNVTPGDLGQVLDIKRPNMVTLIARLEKHGLIFREVHHQDRRSQILTLTEKGEAMLADVEQPVMALDFELSSRWSAEERELFLSLIKRLYE